MIELCSVKCVVCVYTGRGKSIWKWRGDRRTWGVIIGDLVMKRPPLELSWDWCEQKKHCGFSSKNWYLLLLSVRAWFSSKISVDYPRTPLTFMWEYSTPPFPGLRITHDAFPVHGVCRTSYCSICLRCAALFPSYKKVMLENFLRDRHKKINLYRPMQWKQPGSADLYTPTQPSFMTHV